MRRGTQQLPQNIVVPVDDGFIADRDAVEKEMKRNMDEMLDVLYSSSDALPETVASVNAVFSQITEVVGNIKKRKHIVKPHQRGMGVQRTPCT